MIAANVRVDTATIAAVIVRVALERVLALDQLRVLAGGAGEQPVGAANPGVAIEVALKLDRLLVRAGMLVARALSPYCRERARGLPAPP